MPAAKRQNTPTEQNRSNNDLIIYRLNSVEGKVDVLNTKLDKQDNIKRSDLKDFQDTIVTRFLDMRSDLQKQIDNKATKQEVRDFKKQMAGYGAIVLALGLAFFSYILTRLPK